MGWQDGLRRVPLAALALAAMPAAWLLPQHYLPWLAAHQDLAVLALLALAGLVTRRIVVPSKPWGVAALLALGSIAAQRLGGVIHFQADALMAALYVSAFFGAVVVGRSLRQEGPEAALVLSTAILAAAMASVGVALMQATDTRGLALPVAALLPGDRPYANFAQANQFCSAVFMGLCALLYLRESDRVHGGPFWSCAVFLLSGMALSGSRTGLVQVAVLWIMALVRPASCRAGLRPRYLAGMAAMLALLLVAWPHALENIGPAGGRRLEEHVQSGLRLPIWAMALDAIQARPWTGYGWLQIPEAQAAVALQHLDLRRFIDDAHNIVLSLMLWAGVPVGIGVAFAVGIAMWRALRSLAWASDTWLLAAVAGLMAHALLEYPLSYAYLLVPTGILAGLAMAPGEAREAPGAIRHIARAAWAAWACVLVVVAADYLVVEQDYRAVRMEATFGARQITTPPPELRVLDHLQAYLRFVRTEARTGMADSELDLLRSVARRYPHPPVLLRMALAEGLNGHPDHSARLLRQLCAMHTPLRCEEGRQSWAALRDRHPGLRGVAFPERRSPEGDAQAPQPGI